MMVTGFLYFGVMYYHRNLAIMVKGSFLKGARVAKALFQRTTFNSCKSLWKINLKMRVTHGAFIWFHFAGLVDHIKLRNQFSSVGVTFV